MTRSTTPRDELGVIFNPDEGQYFLAPGAGTTTRKREAFRYKRSYFRDMFGPRTFLQFKPVRSRRG